MTRSEGTLLTLLVLAVAVSLAVFAGHEITVALHALGDRIANAGEGF